MHFRSSKLSTPLIIGFFFILINVYFNFPLWKHVFVDDATTLSFHGELLLLHLSAETVYQNILAGLNPFTANGQLLHPFGMSYVLNDLAPINGLYFVFLRPFFSIHQSLSLIAGASIIIAQILMYNLLRRFKISQTASVIMATSFGFSPYLAARMGSQFTFNSIFLFPMLGIALHGIFTSPEKRSKIMYGLLAGLTGAMFVLSNINYTIMAMIMIGLYFIGYLFTGFYKTLNKIIGATPYLALAFFTQIVLLMPWLLQVITLYKQEGIARGSSAGVVEFSGHIFGFFIPSQWNPNYQPLIQKLHTIEPYFTTQFEGFNYPGLFVTVPFAIFLILAVRKKLSSEMFKILFPHAFVALSGAILSLGPYLHIGPQYIFHLAGQPFSIPMPFIFIKYIPMLQNLRAPGRLSLILVFGGTIVAAYLLQRYLTKFEKKPVIIVIILGLFALMYVDQSYIHTPAHAQKVPNTLYTSISKDPTTKTVFEIPFTTRDGVQYVGALDAIFYQMGTFTYDNPIIGSHTGRIHDHIMRWYMRNPFVGYIGNVIDQNPHHAEMFDPLDVRQGTEPDIELMKRTADFLDINTVIVKTDEEYSDHIAEILTRMDYTLTRRDGAFVLYETALPQQAFTCTDFADPITTVQLSRGWEQGEEDERWIENRKASFMIKTPQETSIEKIGVTGYSLQPNTAKVRIDNLHEVELTFDTEKKEYVAKYPATLQPGIHTLHFIFKDTVIPAEIDAASTDTRPLAARISKICVQ